MDSKPHDQFFIKTFSNESNMRVFLKDSLPAKLNRIIDFSYIKFESDTHIDTNLHKNITDLVVKTKTVSDKKPVNIYFLFEHKSKYDNKILFQILRYMVNIWEKDIKRKKKPRIIIPFIFYHGERKWKLKKLRDLLTDNDEIKKWMIDIPYLLFDTAQWDSDKSPKDFGDEMKLRISIEMMKRAYHMDRANLIFIFKLICESGLFNQEFIDYILIYLLEISGLEMEEFMSIIKTEVTIDRDIEVKMISTADRLRQEGSYLKAVETCKKALFSGLPPEVVSQITDLPLEKVLEIQKSLAN
ncbi:MAG: Rpn family recombination-promoting nuclease/putative transposase [bacterium]